MFLFVTSAAVVVVVVDVVVASADANGFKGSNNVMEDDNNGDMRRDRVQMKVALFSIVVVDVVFFVGVIA